MNTELKIFSVWIYKVLSLSDQSLSNAVPFSEGS